MNYELSLIIGDGFINEVCNIVTVSTHFPSTLKKACNEGLQGSYPRNCLQCDGIRRVQQMSGHLRRPDLMSPPFSAQFKPGWN